MWGYVAALLISLAAAGQTPLSGAALPGAIDLGPEFARLGLSPQKQGDRDTCSSFAITALAEFEWDRRNASPGTALSEEFLIWAAHDVTRRPGDQAMFYEAVQGLETLGLCARGLMLYEARGNARRSPSHAALADARARAGRWRPEWIKRWDLERPLNDGQLAAIKRALAAGHPVACGMRWPKELKGHDLREVPAPSQVFDGHSIALTGYRDDPKEPGGGVFMFRNSNGARWGNGGYGSASFAYVRAYANDALWLHLGRSGCEVPLERFEAESLPATARHGCAVHPQVMADFGGPMWSRGRQLFCDAREGGYVELTFAVARPGRYRLRTLATAAPDFARVWAMLDGVRAGSEFDLYSGRVSPSGSLELGTHDLSAGPHRLRFTAVGRNPASKGTLFGLDAVDLLGPETIDER